jgi:hypothetical protein
VPGSPRRTAQELPASARCEAYSMNTLEAVLRVSEIRRSSIIPPVHDDCITPNLHIREASDADGSVFPRCIVGSAVRTRCGPPSRRRSSTGRTPLSGEWLKWGRGVCMDLPLDGSSLLLWQRMGPMKWFSDLSSIKQPPEHAGAASESSLFHTSVSCSLGVAKPQVNEDQAVCGTLMLFRARLRYGCSKSPRNAFRPVYHPSRFTWKSAET